MSLKTRAMSLAIAAAMLTAPAASLAEASYDAGELTKTVIADSYEAGNQINLDVALGLDVQEKADSERMRAAASLLGKSRLHLSFYDDFGTARIRATLNVDNVDLLTADVLVFEDGSVQAMTNLTGKLVLALPAGSITDGGLSLNSLTETDVEYDFDTKEGREAFNTLPARTRLAITGNDMISMLINHLLGWVSYMQMDNDGEFYVFDDTYIDETDTRDAVAQRMLGTIKADSFTTLFLNITQTIADEKGDFQQALADVLAEAGVTRCQARQFIDALLTEETIDPAVDYVQPSYFIIHDNDTSPIQYDDVSYFFKKLNKSAQRVWENSTPNVLHMDVSYDDAGQMVGFDADMPQFTTVLPYAGTFVYSIKTDDNWQRLHTSHGELQLDERSRAVGDLHIQFGEDVDGVKESSLTGALDVVSQADGTSGGFGVDAGLTYTVAAGDSGVESETFEGSVVLLGRVNGESAPSVAATVSGETVTDGDTFDVQATAALEADGIATLVADMAMEQVDYDEADFAGGQALDLTQLDDAKLTTLREEITRQTAKLGMSLLMHPGVMADLTTLVSK